METRGFGWRVPASILIVMGWLAFVIIWLFFFASDYSIYKNLAILFVSILIGLAVLVSIWVGYGLRMSRMYGPSGEWAGYRQLRWRVALNVVVLIGWCLFFLIWLFLYADGFSGYQNIAVIFVSLLVAGGLSAAIWSGWKRYGPYPPP